MSIIMRQLGLLILGDVCLFPLLGLQEDSYGGDLLCMATAAPPLGITRRDSAASSSTALNSLDITVAEVSAAMHIMLQ